MNFKSINRKSFILTLAAVLGVSVIVTAVAGRTSDKSVPADNKNINTTQPSLANSKQPTVIVTGETADISIECNEIKIYITPRYVVGIYIQNAQNKKSRRSELVSDFCDFFQIFPVQTVPVLMLPLICRTFPWCYLPRPGTIPETSSRSGTDRPVNQYKLRRPA